MTKRHFTAILALLASLWATATLLQARSHGKESSFLIHPNRPFVYLEFDHLGPGIPRGEDEPASRVWFRLTNNSRVPVTIRTFGAPDGSPKYEIGVMYEVVRNRPTQGPMIIMPPAQSNMSNDEQRDEPTPIGYMFEVGSMQGMEPGDQALFSVPINHLSKRWHLEIPFEFDLPAGKEPRKEEVGGTSEMVISYSVWDLPPKVRAEIGNR